MLLDCNAQEAKEAIIILLADWGLQLQHKRRFGVSKTLSFTGVGYTVTCEILLKTGQDAMTGCHVDSRVVHATCR